MIVSSIDVVPHYGPLIFTHVNDLREALLQLAKNGVPASLDAMKYYMGARDYRPIMIAKARFDAGNKDQFLSDLNRNLNRLSTGKPLDVSYGNDGYGFMYKTSICARRFRFEQSYQYHVSINTLSVSDRVNEELSARLKLKRAVDHIDIVVTSEPVDSRFVFDMNPIARIIAGLSHESKSGADLANDMMNDIIRHYGVGTAEVSNGRLVIKCHINPMTVETGVVFTDSANQPQWLRDGSVISGPLTGALSREDSKFYPYAAPQLVISVSEKSRPENSPHTHEPALIDRMHTLATQIERALAAVC